MTRDYFLLLPGSFLFSFLEGFLRHQIVDVTCLADLESIRNYYSVEQWIIGGHSWGADLALLYSLEHSSRVAGLICVAGGRIHDDREWHGEYQKRKTAEGEYLPNFFTHPTQRLTSR